MDGETFVLLSAFHLSNTVEYKYALIVVMNLSASIRRKIIESADLFANKQLNHRLKRAMCYPSHIPTLYRAKFLPFTGFIEYIEDRISNGDFRPLKLYFENRKKDTSLPALRICIGCAKKRFITQQLKGYLQPSGPCDLEKVEKPPEPVVVQPKRKIADIAIGPDDPRFNVGWINETAPKVQRVIPNEQPGVELTEEEKNRLLVETLTRREPVADPFEVMLYRLGLR